METTKARHMDSEMDFDPDDIPISAAQLQRQKEHPYTVVDDAVPIARALRITECLDLDKHKFQVYDKEGKDESFEGYPISCLDLPLDDPDIYHALHQLPALRTDNHPEVPEDRLKLRADEVKAVIWAAFAHAQPTDPFFLILSDPSQLESIADTIESYNVFKKTMSEHPELTRKEKKPYLPLKLNMKIAIPSVDLTDDELKKHMHQGLKRIAPHFDQVQITIAVTPYYVNFEFVRKFARFVANAWALNKGDGDASIRILYQVCEWKGPRWICARSEADGPQQEVFLFDLAEYHTECVRRALNHQEPKPVYPSPLAAYLKEHGWYPVASPTERKPDDGLTLRPLEDLPPDAIYVTSDPSESVPVDTLEVCRVAPWPE